MRSVWVLALIAVGCGRIGFDTDSGDASGDIVLGHLATDPALIGYYPFDDDPNDGVNNRAAGFGDAQCNTSCPTQIAGVHGTAFHFNGSSDEIVIADRPELHLTRGTLALWVSLDLAPADGQFTSFAGKAHDILTQNSYELFLSNVNPDGVILHGGGDALAHEYIDTAWTAPTGSWVHLALTWDTTLRMYVAGALAGESPPFSPVFDANPVTIGADLNNAVVSSYLRGRVDEVWIFSRQLSDDEITALASVH